MPTATRPAVNAGIGTSGITIRPATAADLPAIVALDEKETGLPKCQYWRELFAHFSQKKGGGRAFLVAEAGGEVAGFITGEVRAFEFGSEPCGWVFALHVAPEYREHDIGTRLFETICATFRRAGVAKVRTMLARDNDLVLAFFRSQGMMAGPFIQLEMELE